MLCALSQCCEGHNALPMQDQAQAPPRKEPREPGKARRLNSEDSEDLDAKAKADRTKAKNKRAQKKFRQRQKEKHEELERSAAELSAKLRVTLGELDALQNQRRVLEIALSRNVEGPEASATASQVALPPYPSRSNLLLHGHAKSGSSPLAMHF